MRPMRADSATISRRIRQREAPIARLIPISRVRSATDIAIVLTTDSPPTSRLMSPMPTRIELRIAVEEPISLSKSAPVMVETPGMAAVISAAIVAGLVPEAG